MKANFRNVGTVVPSRSVIQPPAYSLIAGLSGCMGCLLLMGPGAAYAGTVGRRTRLPHLFQPPTCQRWRRRFRLRVSFSFACRWARLGRRCVTLEYLEADVFAFLGPIAVLNRTDTEEDCQHEADEEQKVRQKNARPCIEIGRAHV